MDLIKAPVDELLSTLITATWPEDATGTYALSTMVPFTVPAITAVEPEFALETFTTVTSEELDDTEPFTTVTGTMPTWETVAVTNTVI
jgi:hypothetical protein